MRLQAKVVLIGNSGVGKTSIALRYLEGRFSLNPPATVGASYAERHFSYNDGTKLKLHIWDTGGSEKFRSMISLYYKDVTAAIICYDLSDEKSFNAVHYWINELINKSNNDSDSFILALAGNKSDLDPA